MLLPESKKPPDLWTTTLDEILSVGIVVDPKVDHLFGPIAATVVFDEAIDGRLDLTASSWCNTRPAGGRADGNAPPRLDHATCAHAPSRREHHALPPQPLIQTLAEFRKSLPSESSPKSV